MVRGFKFRFIAFSLWGAIVVCGGLRSDKMLAAEKKAPDKSHSKRERTDNDSLPASVRLLSAKEFNFSRQNKSTQALLRNYYDAILDWALVLGKRYRPVPGHPDMGYYGDSGNTENSVRPICYATMTNAFLAEVDSPSDSIDQRQRAGMRRESIAAIRYLAQAHKANGGTCLNGRAWGNQWQSAMWARSLGTAAWLLWHRLDEPTKLAVARVIEYEADRFINRKPKSSLKNDTGAEENAWNAGLLALARCMMPKHPRATQWDEAAKRYMYNTFSVASDHTDKSIGDDGLPLATWVTTVNAHPDYTVENHGLVHVGYLKNSHAMLLENASPYVMAGEPVPKAAMHHLGDVFEVLLKCMSWEGAAIYFGGNDWKLVHTQCSDIISAALANVLLKDARAAYVERVALDWIRLIQNERAGCYTVRNDLEHNGFVASRLIICYLIHAKLGLGVPPVSREEFEKSITGITEFEHGQAILHRTQSKFASFAWSKKRMALAMPKQGTWVIWPHYASYLGYIDGKDSSARHAKLLSLNRQVLDDCFSVTGSLKRCKGKLVQDFSFVSLNGDVAVYVERIRGINGYRPSTRETGVIGHEYECGKNTRNLQGRFGTVTVTGIGGNGRVLALNSDWLNIGDKVGYVVRRGDSHRNIMRYHDQTKGTGRVPKLQEWLSLIGEETGQSPSTADDWACVVTFLNQSTDQTASWAGRVLFEVDSDIARCRVGDITIEVDFAQKKTSVEKTARTAGT